MTAGEFMGEARAYLVYYREERIEVPRVAQPDGITAGSLDTPRRGQASCGMINYTDVDSSGRGAGDGRGRI